MIKPNERIEPNRNAVRYAYIAGEMPPVYGGFTQTGKDPQLAMSPNLVMNIRERK